MIHMHQVVCFWSLWCQQKVDAAQPSQRNSRWPKVRSCAEGSPTVETKPLLVSTFSPHTTETHTNIQTHTYACIQSYVHTYVYNILHYSEHQFVLLKLPVAILLVYIYEYLHNELLSGRYCRKHVMRLSRYQSSFTCVATPTVVIEQLWVDCSWPRLIPSQPLPLLSKPGQFSNIHHLCYQQSSWVQFLTLFNQLTVLCILRIMTERHNYITVTTWQNMQ